MILTIDIGNSRIKWAAWSKGVIVERAAEAYGSEVGEALDRLKAVTDSFSDESPDHIYALCVAGDLVSQQLDEWVGQTWRLPIKYLRTEKRYKDIVNAYQDPARHGADRWAALIAASNIWPGESICVICAGTAITFDLLKHGEQHLGGYILPTYNSMHSALLSNTEDVQAGLSGIIIKSGVPDNTNDAVNQGIHILLQSGIRTLCLKAAQELGENMRIVLTGGYAESILQYPDMLPMVHSPDLIMQGLYDSMSLSSSLRQSRAVSES